MKVLKVGWIDFLNTAPFNFQITGIKTEYPVQFIKGYPSDINLKLRNKEIDVGFISSAEYITNFREYLIFPDLSISALNKVQSVCIFSDKPLEKIKEIYLTKASKTSRLLTKVIFEIFLEKNVIYKELESKRFLKEKTVLLIGDKAIKYKSHFKYVYDLSDIWYRKTKLPFVFALWCVRKDIFSESRKTVVDFAQKLKKSKEKFFSDIDLFSRKINTEFERKTAINYLKNLDYCLTSEHLKSLKLFSEYLLKLHIIYEIPEFRFIR